MIPGTKKIRLLVIHGGISEYLECARRGDSGVEHLVNTIHEVFRIANAVLMDRVTGDSVKGLKLETFMDVLRWKHEYNKTRPRKHGKEF